MSTKPKKMTPQQVTKIKELSDQGLSSYKIAKEMKIPPGVARYHIQRKKLSQLPSQPTPNVSRPTTTDSSELVRLKNMNKQLLDMLNKLMGA